MKISNKVKIGGYTYAVERPDEPFVASGNVVCDGVHIFNEQLIKVAKSGSSAYQETVFLHEICHAIIASYCSEECYDEEKFVEQFSKGLYQVITDNPEIFNNSSSV